MHLPGKCVLITGAGHGLGRAIAQEALKAGYRVVVTARRVEERLQDVPISMTVYNQQELADRNIVLATDLASYTPSLSVNQRFGPEKSSFSLRGFNQDQNTAPTVGVYFAGMAITIPLAFTFATCACA